MQTAIARDHRIEDAGASLHDGRFRRLIGSQAWAELRPAIRARFDKCLQGSQVAVYSGEVVACRMNPAGRVLAAMCRLIGGPLPLHRDAGVAAVVIVSEDAASGGQRWTRIYHRRRGAPQAINSAKVFAGPTGLEEHIGCGFGMALRVEPAAGRLVFVSDHYFWKLRNWRLRLPHWMSPGETRVTHQDMGGGTFAFELEVHHGWLGELVHQRATFRDG